MKKKFRFAVSFILAALMIACALCLTACGDPEAIEGEGGIVPEGYRRIDVENSSFYVPMDSTHAGKQDTLDVYTFSEGQFNINVVESGIKIQRLSRNSFNKTLSKEMSANGLSYTLDEYKFYKLSGLWILADELTITSGSKSIKEYQYSYNAGKSQVTITIAFNDVNVAVESDFPAKLLYSISVE